MPPLPQTQTQTPDIEMLRRMLATRPADPRQTLGLGNPPAAQIYNPYPGIPHGPPGMSRAVEEEALLGKAIQPASPLAAGIGQPMGQQLPGQPSEAALDPYTDPRQQAAQQRLLLALVLLAQQGQQGQRGAMVQPPALAGPSPLAGSPR
jgi:hypothetical protein